MDPLLGFKYEQQNCHSLSLPLVDVEGKADGRSGYSHGTAECKFCYNMIRLLPTVEGYFPTMAFIAK
jgi:hypothetical protein